MNKDTFYFPHDYEPTSDPKMTALVGEYGAVGYGIYWRIVEMLHSAPNNSLEQREYIFIGIGKQLLTPVEQVKAVVAFCIDVCNLFYISNNEICCARVFKNIEKRKEVLKQKSLAGKASAEKRKKAKKATAVEQPLTAVQHNPTKERKGKERKGNTKKRIAEQSSAGVFKDCIELYNSFILKQTGTKAKLDGANGKSLKTIISYFTANAPPDIENKDAEVITSFDNILKHFSFWEPFHQKQLKLTQINSNLINIISAIKKTAPPPAYRQSQGMNDAEYNTFMYGNPKGITG